MYLDIQPQPHFTEKRLIFTLGHCFEIDYFGIIRIRGGSVFVESMGTPHPRIYILNETIS